MTPKEEAFKLMDDLGQQDNNWFQTFLDSMTHVRNQSIKLEKIKMVPNPKGTISPRNSYATRSY